VTTSNTGPLIPRRRLGAAFKQLREARGETLQQTSKALLFSPSKLSRIENGSASEPHPRDVRDLIAHFGVEGDAAAELEALAEAGRQPGWWQLPPYEFTGDLDTFISYESAASRICEYSPVVVPGLLQTDEYAGQVFRTFLPDVASAQIERLVTGRMQRQHQIESRPARPERVHVAPETILHRLVGTPSVMATQMAALLDSSNEPSIELHIIPYTSGLYEGAHLTTTTLFAFESAADSDVVAIERIRHTEFLERLRTVEKYREILDRLSQYWLDENKSKEFIELAWKKWRGK
jgi:transcriptional regulator with XRE-family HTH domain